MNPTHAKEKVLFIYADDDKDDHFFLSEACAGNFQASEMRSVYDGVDLVEILSVPPPLRPDFIVVDINMPKMDGLTAIHIIRKELHLESFPIFILSTSQSPDVISMAKEYGVQGIYSKPTGAIDLTKIINEIFIISSAYSYQAS